MVRTWLAGGWAPDRRTIGLVVAGYSLVATAGELVFANTTLAVWLNMPQLAGLPGGAQFNFPVAQRVAAAAGLIGACATAVAVAGGVGLLLGRHWAVPLTSGAIGLMSATVVVNIFALQTSLRIIGDVLRVVWLLALIALINGWRPQLPLPPRHLVTRDGDWTGSWIEDARRAEGEHSPEPP